MGGAASVIRFFKFFILNATILLANLIGTIDRTEWPISLNNFGSKSIKQSSASHWALL